MNSGKRRQEQGLKSVGSIIVFATIGLALLAFLVSGPNLPSPNTVDVVWNWLSVGESGSATLRNIGLLIVAAIGMPFAIWRTMVAGKQAQIAQRSLRNERYQKAVEMLGNSVLSVRLGGIYALHQLAKEEPAHYHVQAMRLFSAFLRHPPALSTTDTDQMATLIEVAGQEAKSGTHVRRDIEDIFRTLGARTKEEIEVETKSGYELVIYEANLRGLKIRDVTEFKYTLDPKKGTLTQHERPRRENLSNVHFRRVDFSNVDLSFTNMSEGEFWDPTFVDARLEETDLSGTSWDGGTLEAAMLSSADLSNANFLRVSMSGANMDRANLTGVVFQETDLSGATFRDANISGACFSSFQYRTGLLSRSGIKRLGVEAEGLYVGVRNLTQGQIDQARADPKNPPLLDGITDPNTGEQLVWRGKPLST